MIRQFSAAAAITGAVLGAIVLVAQDPQARDRSDDAELTAAERDSAAALAGRAIQQRALVATGPIYLTRVELLRDKTEEDKEAPARRALVTHYRYLGDLTILTAVDLTRRTVMSIDTAVGMVAPLAREEFERARRLALADPRVRRALGGEAERVTVEALLTRAADRRDPLYGRRVVRLLFRVGQDYLSEPVVMVDLSAGSVQVESARR